MNTIEPKSLKRESLEKKPNRHHRLPAALLFCGLLLCGACSWLGLQVAGPLQQAGKLHNENDVLERDLRRLQIQDQSLQKQIQAMNTDQGIIIAARQKGYMLQEERPLHIQKEGAPLPSTIGAPAPEQTPSD